MAEDILNKVISFITGDGENLGDKEVLLKQLTKEIQQNKYARFYRARQGEADSSFAQYFYSIFKIVTPARKFFNDPGIMTKLGRVVLESYLDTSVLDLIKRLTPEAVAERKKTAGADISKQLEKDLASLSTGFDNPKLAEADKCYNLLVVFNRFVSWDYFSFLKKFDPELTEDFSSPPKFTPQKADTVMADIATFLSILPSFDPGDDWKRVMEIVNYCRSGKDLFPLETWNGLLANLKDLKQSRMLELMVRLASENPVWDTKPAPHHDEQLSALWLEKKTEEIRRVISGIAAIQRSVQIATMEKAVFDLTDTTRLSYYNKEKGKILIQKEMDGYIHAPALNHLLAFIQDFINKEINDLCDIMLVRGQWTNNTASIAMSEAFHTLRDIPLEITALDESLSEEGSNGPRIRGALLRVDRDHSQARYLNNIVDILNEEALGIINKAVPALIVIGKHLKMLLDDFQKKPFELIMNWKELTLVSKTPLDQRFTNDYKKINYFVQLMLLETKSDEQGS